MGFFPIIAQALCTQRVGVDSSGVFFGPFFSSAGLMAEPETWVLVLCTESDG